MLKNYKILNHYSLNLLKTLSIHELKILAEETRDYIIKIVSKNGGHLSSNLGIVELTISLLYVFNAKKDKIIFDVGHQIYTYKILTDRLNEFKTLRTFNGISGFPKITESKFDAFGTGHSSTSISAALGFAVARDLQKTSEKIIAIIGDGAMTGGQAFEALNNAGSLKKDLIVILNDNEMFISKKVGALGKYLTKILSGNFLKKIKNIIIKILSKLKIKQNIIKKLINRIKTLFTPGIIFEELGFTYFGPIDGNDINILIEILKKIKNFKGPILLHIFTKKGKGYKPAEQNPIKFHGTKNFNISTGDIQQKSNPNIKTFTQIFSETLLEEAKKNDKIIAITAAMSEGTGLKKFEENFPERFFDVGIAEQHAITFAAALAKSGLKPICAIYSTFLQRAFDQIIHDTALQNLPVIFAIDRSGIVGEDGPTHHGIFDISFLNIIPNITIMSPRNGAELKAMFSIALKLNKPVAIRYPKANDISNDKFLEIKDLNQEIIYNIGEICVFTNGIISTFAKIAIENLIKENIKIKLIHIRIIKPINSDFIKNITKQNKIIITIEENILNGGLNTIIKNILINENKQFFSIGINDEFIPHGEQNLLYDLYNLSINKIYKFIKTIYIKNFFQLLLGIIL